MPHLCLLHTTFRPPRRRTLHSRGVPQTCALRGGALPAGVCGQDMARESNHLLSNGRAINAVQPTSRGTAIEMLMHIRACIRSQVTGFGGFHRLRITVVARSPSPAPQVVRSSINPDAFVARQTACFRPPEDIADAPDWAKPSAAWVRQFVQVRLRACTIRLICYSLPISVSNRATCLQITGFCFHTVVFRTSQRIECQERGTGRPTVSAALLPSV